MAKRKSAEDICSDIIGEIKKKIYKPIYFLTGDEPYYIDLIADYIADNVLSESEKAFNQTVLYGKESSIPAIIEISRRFPMMANHQVVIFKEAQLLKNLEDIEVYIKAPQKSTVLVICYKLLPGTKLNVKVKKAFDMAAKVGVGFDSRRLYDNQIPSWINSYLAKKSMEITPTSTELLRDFLGNDLSKIANELEKLIVTIPPETKRINPEHIEQNIGISKDFNRFELTKAIGIRDVLKANRIIDYFAKNLSPKTFPQTITVIYQYFNKIFTYHFLKDKSEHNVSIKLSVHSFFISEYKQAAKYYPPRKCVQVFSLLREYDMKSKGVNNESVDHGELLKELLFKIIH